MATADLIVKIITDTSQAKGLDETATKAGKFKAGLQKASAGAAVALAAVGAAAISAAKAAAEDQASQAALAETMRKNTGATTSQIKATEDWISAQMRATGIADDELRPALGTLVRATGDVEKSQKALKVAMDVSAATGKPLESVSTALAKGFGGTTTSIGKLVPGLSKAALESGNMSRIMAELKNKTEGAAVAAGNTAAGQMKKFQNSLDEAQESIGGALLPVLQKIIPKLTAVGRWAEEHPAAFQAIAAAIAAIATAIIVLNVVVTVYTAITTLAAAATFMAVLPWILVGLAILGVIAIFVILWKKCDAFRKAVKAVWAAIKAGAKAVARFVKSVWSATWKAISAAAKAMARFVTTAWGKIKSGAKAAVDVIRNVWRNLSNAIRNVLNAIKTAAGRVWDWIKDKARSIVDNIKGVFESLKARIRAVFDGIRNAFSAVIGKAQDLIAKIRGIQVPGSIEAAFDRIKSAIGNIIDFVQNLISAIRNIPTPSINWPTPPKWLDKITGRAVVPAAPGVAGYAAPGVPGVSARGVSAGGSGVQVNIYGALDPEGVARQVGRILGAHDRRMGRAPA